MKIKKIPSEFLIASPILKKLNEAHFEAYFVGGSVRDTLLGQPIHDVDIATSAFPAEVKRIFTHTVDTGIQHGTVMILDHGEGYEITTFRTESGYTDFRRPDHVRFVRSLSEDLKRRDFTINALAMTREGEVIDLFDGLNDLNAGIIRAVGDPAERFGEDALRMMRALRFSAQLGFTIEEQTCHALATLVPNLEKIAVERIQVEFEKLMMGKNAAHAIEFGITHQLFNYLPSNMRHWRLSIWQDIRHDLLENQPVTIAGIWSYLAVKSGENSHEINTLLREWKLSRTIMRTTTAIVPVVYHIQAGIIKAWDLFQVADYQDTLLEVLALLPIRSVVIGEVKKILSDLPIKHANELTINGQDLMAHHIVPAGPQLGQMLRRITEQVVTGELINDRQVLMNYARRWRDEQN